MSTVQQHRQAAATGDRLFGTSVRRKEDRRLITGAAEYVGNIEPPGTLHVAFVRSDVAHAVIRDVDLGPALALPGVVDGVTGADLEGRCRPIVADSGYETWQSSTQWPLARERVRFVGEALAAVVARTRYEAEDGVELVRTDVRQLEPVMSIDASLRPDAPRLHDGWEDNCFVKRWEHSGDPASAFAAAPHSLRLTCQMGRHGGVPMETRGCVASYDPNREEMTLWTSHQMPHVLRTVVAGLLDFPEHQLRVIAPDVGGGFGIKSNVYPEELVLCLLTLKLGRPVKWIEDRREHLLVAAHARDHRHEVEVAYDHEGVVQALRARVLVDCGAYSLFPWTAGMDPGTALAMLPGPYRIRNYEAEGYALATNKCPSGPYRGIARVPACFTIERVMDQVARALDLDPLEVRRRNLIRPGDFPYVTATGNIYDSGSYLESLETLERATDLVSLRMWQANERERGRHIGIGVACFVEQTGHGIEEYVRRRVDYVFGYDKAVVRMDPSGHATVLTGIHSHGQGLETTLAQIAADRLGLGLEDVRVVFGDTESCPYGNGTFGSRSAVLCGGAVELAARKVRERLLAVGAYLIAPDSREVDDLELEDGRVYRASDPDRSVSIAEIAHTIHLRPDRLPQGVDSILEAVATYDADPGRGTFSNGAHLAVVEVDDETGHVQLLRYVVVDDCGRMINPMIVAGQIHGGVCQGIGGALYEEFLYDEEGNPLSTTFLDYLLPSTTDIPDIEVFHVETPSPFTLNGVKGVGESGTIAAAAALGSAVEDALRRLGHVVVNETPLTPERVLRFIDAAVNAERP